MRNRRISWLWSLYIKCKRKFSIRTLFVMMTVFCVTILALVQAVASINNLSEDYNNYFLDLSTLKDRRLLINSTNCQIPYFDPWESSIYPFFKIEKPRVVCNKANYNWSSIIGNELVLYSENMQKDGYTLYPGFCCYRTITRIQQSETHYDKNADNVVSISDECAPLENARTVISAEFAIVECASAIRKLARFTTTYRAFHGSAMSGASGKEKVRNKVSYWENKSDELKAQKKEITRPPDVLIVGLDSTSRLNFRRYMPKTLSVLERIGATEMLGYTKVGANTFPNFIPLMTGYPEEDLVKICWSQRYVKQDNCPSIWKRFETANYLTGHVEDFPGLGIFNYQKTGFVKQPVDFYSRPLFKAVSKYAGPFQTDEDDHIDCLGPNTNDEGMLSYLESIVDFGHASRAPVFAASWSTTVSHDSNTGIQLLDQPYEKFLLRLIEKGYLDNMVMFFMGDHGYRFGKIRETLMGFYEDKLPNMWIYLGPKVKKQFPLWEDALHINSRRLTSPFNLYWTFNHILQMSNLPPPEDALEEGTRQVIPRQYRYSFVEEIPEEVSCRDLGVPTEFCACNPLSVINLNDTLVQQAAQLVVEEINIKILANSPCLPLKVARMITAATRMHVREEVERFIVSFVSDPGDFLVEGEVNYSKRNETFMREVNVHRASKMNADHIRCIHDAKKELFCYCPN